MSELFAGLTVVCGLTVASLLFATVLIVTEAGTTNWMLAAIVAWSTLGALILGALFGIAAFAIGEDEA